MTESLTPPTVDTELAAAANGTSANPVRVDPTGTTAQPITDNAGTLTVDQATAANLNAQMVGEVANDGVDSGNPLKIGGRAGATVPAAISASGDRVNAFFDQHGRLHVRTGVQSVVPWTAIHVPAANTVATASKAAAGAGVRNVCTTITVVLAATATAPTAIQVVVNLIDGASGGVTYLWRANISLPATAGAMNGIALSGLWLEGTANTALTLEFSAAGGANTVESVTMSGVVVTE